MTLIFSFLLFFIFVGIGLGFFLRLRYLGQLVFSAWAPLIASYERKWMILRELEKLIGVEDKQISSLKNYFIQNDDEYKKITAGSLCHNSKIVKRIWNIYHSLSKDTQQIYKFIEVFDPKAEEIKEQFVDFIENLWAVENKIAYHSFRYIECVSLYNGLFQRILFSSFFKIFGWEASFPVPKEALILS